MGSKKRKRWREIEESFIFSSGTKNFKRKQSINILIRQLIDFAKKRAKHPIKMEMLGIALHYQFENINRKSGVIVKKMPNRIKPMKFTLTEKKANNILVYTYQFLKFACVLFFSIKQPKWYHPIYCFLSHIHVQLFVDFFFP